MSRPRGLNCITPCTSRPILAIRPAPDAGSLSKTFGKQPVEVAVFSAVPAESDEMPSLSPDSVNAVLFGDDVKESKLLIVEINGRRTP